MEALIGMYYTTFRPVWEKSRGLDIFLVFFLSEKLRDLYRSNRPEHFLKLFLKWPQNLLKSVFVSNCFIEGR